MKNEISYGEALRKALDFPTRKILWRYGYAYKGALEYEIKMDELKEKFDESVLVELKSETQKEIHLNGYSANDMW